MNIVLIIIDTLRQDHVGAYGNPWIVTPHLDAFAKEAVVFTRGYPESLPTLPVRRALFTGKRVYPFHDHQDYRGDFRGAPGWGSIPEDQDTLAEILGRHGYRTALVSDTYHLFKPSRNYHRGFDEWVWIRGQEHDNYRSGPPMPIERIAAHMTEPPDQNPKLAHFLEKYLRNVAFRTCEEEYFPAQVFREATRWIVRNQDAERFFLVVDSFDPHEPWEPPVGYRKLYDPQDDCADLIQSLYTPWRGLLTARELKRLQANYAGEVTLVDRWFGYFMEALRYAGRLDNTVVAVISDHGHNLGHDPGDKGLVSKQGHPMTHAVADLVLMIRHPRDEGAGTRCDKLMYNFDLTGTLLALAGVESDQPMDGLNCWPAVLNSGYPTRDYLTIAWGPLITAIDETYWFNASIWGEAPLLYAYREDPELTRNLADERPEVCQQMLAYAIEDAGGQIPEAFKEYRSLPGCTPYLG